MQITNIHEAKTNLSHLIQMACKGEEIIICKAGEPMVKLVKYTVTKPRKAGLCKGKIKISKSFDKLPQELLDAFSGKGE